MSCGLPREVLKWILSLDLSYAVKNPKRDFANGFLYAEILSRYYPADVQMHSFENVASMERKKSNWALLEKLIKRKRIPVERSQIEAVIAAEGDTAVEVLQSIFSFIHSPSYEASKAQAAAAAPSPERNAAAQLRDRGYEASTSGQPDYMPSAGQYEQQQQMYGQQMPNAMYFGGGGGGGGGYAVQQAQQQQQSPAMYQQVAMGMQQQQQQANGYGSYAAVAQQQQYAAKEAGAGGYGYGYGYAQQQQMGAAAGYAAQMQQQQVQQQAQQQQQRAPQQQRAQPQARAQQQAAVGRSVSPGRGGPRSQPQQQEAAPMAVAAGGGYAAAYALAYAEQMRQQAVAAGYNLEQQQLVYQQALYQYQQQQQAAAMAAAGGGGNGAEESPEREGLPFSKKPRAVDFKPYDMKDFEDKDYNVKGGRAYWQLGKLGPDLETEELQAKRESKERIKKMAEQVREDNAKRANSRARQRPGETVTGAPAASPGLRDRDKDKEPSARDRALLFAKNIPKPEPKPQKKQAASQSGEAYDEPPVLSELEVLERQHQERQQQVDKIRAELARIL